MPVLPPRLPILPSKPVKTLADVAQDNQIVMIRCNLCRRRMNYLAADLIKVIEPTWPAHLPPFQCSRCKKSEYIDVAIRLPRNDDYGNIVIRKLVGVVQVPTWKTVRFGEK